MSVSIERVSVSIEPVSVSIERVSVSIEPVSVSIERVSVSIERVSVSIEPVSVSIERVSVSIERVSVSIERVSDSIERVTYINKNSPSELTEGEFFFDLLKFLLFHHSFGVQYIRISIEYSNEIHSAVSDVAPAVIFSRKIQSIDSEVSI